jgi:hypothetical protein
MHHKSVNVIVKLDGENIGEIKKMKSYPAHRSLLIRSSHIFSYRNLRAYFINRADVNSSFSSSSAFSDRKLPPSKRKQTENHPHKIDRNRQSTAIDTNAKNGFRVKRKPGANISFSSSRSIIDNQLTRSPDNPSRYEAFHVCGNCCAFARTSRPSKNNHRYRILSFNSRRKRYDTHMLAHSRGCVTGANHGINSVALCSGA